MSNLIIKKAKLKNLKDLIYLLFEDDIGKERENLSDKSMNKYKKSFTKILKDSNNEICIMTLNDQIIGMMQLTFIPGLSMQGITRCQIESVRIKKEYRDKGYGSKLINHLIDEAKKLNIRRLSLETGAGEFFMPARKLFTRCGFRDCEPFSDYKKNVNSIYLTKLINNNN